MMLSRRMHGLKLPRQPNCIEIGQIFIIELLYLEESTEPIKVAYIDDF